MSTIVAVKNKTHICLAVDTQTMLGNTIERSENAYSGSKIIEYADSVIGYVGHASFYDAFNYFAETVDSDYDLHSRSGIFKFSLEMYNFFNDELHLSYEEEDCHYSPLGHDFLICNKSGIFGLSSERSITEFKDFASYGTGYKFALGNLYNKDYSGNGAENISTIAKSAITCSCFFDDVTGNPIEYRLIER